MSAHDHTGAQVARERVYRLKRFCRDVDRQRIMAVYTWFLTEHLR